MGPPDALRERSAKLDAPPSTPARCRRYVDRFAAAGCDELVLLPCDPDPAQVDLLTDALVARRAPQ
jgi:hypothetical protein